MKKMLVWTNCENNNNDLVKNYLNYDSIRLSEICTLRCEKCGDPIHNCAYEKRINVDVHLTYDTDVTITQLNTDKNMLEKTKYKNVKISMSPEKHYYSILIALKENHDVDIDKLKDYDIEFDLIKNNYNMNWRQEIFGGIHNKQL